jgi:hypothetical protein
MSGRLGAAGVLRSVLPAPAAAPRAMGKTALYKILVVTALTVGAGLGTQKVLQRGLPASSTAAATTSRATAPPPSSSQQSSRATDTETPQGYLAEHVATISVNDLPSAKVEMPSPRSTALSSAGATTPGSVEVDSASAELALIRRAQAALVTDPSRALALAGEHERAFPNGELVQEREVVATEALQRLGQREEAWRRADALLRRFPRTPYRTRLEIALGRTLSPNSTSDLAP